jgi:hypothetical protein
MSWPRKPPVYYRVGAFPRAPVAVLNASAVAEQRSNFHPCELWSRRRNQVGCLPAARPVDSLQLVPSSPRHPRPRGCSSTLKEGDRVVG